MTTTFEAGREALFRQMINRLRDRAPLLHNMWAMVGRGEPRDVAELAKVLWFPEDPPAERARQQNRVGAFMAHLNARIAEHNAIIKPGAVRGTYQLYCLATWEQDQAALRAKLITAGESKRKRPALAKRAPRAPETKPRTRKNKSA